MLVPDRRSSAPPQFRTAAVPHRRTATGLGPPLRTAAYVRPRTFALAHVHPLAGPSNRSGALRLLSQADAMLERIPDAHPEGRGFRHGLSQYANALLHLR